MGVFVEKSFREIIGRSPSDAIYKGAAGAQRYKTDYDRYIAALNVNRASYAARLASEAESRGALLDAQEALIAAAPCGALDFNCYLVKLKRFFSGAAKTGAIILALVFMSYFAFIFLRLKK